MLKNRESLLSLLSHLPCTGSVLAGIVRSVSNAYFLFSRKECGRLTSFLPSV